MNFPIYQLVGGPLDGHLHQMADCNVGAFFQLITGWHAHYIVRSHQPTNVWPCMDFAGYRTPQMQEWTHDAKRAK